MNNVEENKISVLLIEPNKYPKMIEIEDTLEAMQSVVGGDIEEYMPFDVMKKVSLTECSRTVRCTLMTKK